MIATQFGLQRPIPFSTSLHTSAYSGKSLYPLNFYVNCDKFFDNDKKFLASVSVVSEPTRLSDVVTDSN